MAKPSFKQKVMAVVGKRKSLRSPRRTMNILRKAHESNNRAMHFSCLAWPKLVSAILFTYILFALPTRPDVGPVLDLTYKAVLTLNGYFMVYVVWWRTQQSWRVRERRLFRQKLLAVQYSRLEPKISS